MDKLEEARTLATDLEFAHDNMGDRGTELEVYEYPWRHKMDILRSLIEQIDGEMSGDDGVIAARLRLDEARDVYADTRDRLVSVARELVDAEAFFPSKKKSEVLTDRITLKSQMPSLPTVEDPLTLIEALVADGRLREFAKGVSIKLDNDVAEAVMRWWANREDQDVGLEAPQPKILNIKVKPKEES